MKIKGLKPTLVPSVPTFFQDKLEFRTTTNLSEYDAKLFVYALMKLEEQIIEEKLSLDGIPKAFAIFTDNGELSFELTQGVLGLNVHLITYAIKRWDEYNLTEVGKVAVFLEELCHWIWNISDEVKVKYKVFEVLERIYPNIKFEQVFKI